MQRRATLAGVAARGDRRRTLEVLRDRLARQLDECTSSRDVAALSKQLADVLKQIEELPAPKKETPRDELAQRRARTPDAPRPLSPAASRKRSV